MSGPTVSGLLADVERLAAERDAARENHRRAMKQRDALWLFVFQLAKRGCTNVLRSNVGQTCVDLGHLPAPSGCIPCEARRVLRGQDPRVEL